MTQTLTTTNFELGWHGRLLEAVLGLTVAAGLVGQLGLTALWLKS